MRQRWTKNIAFSVALIMLSTLFSWSMAKAGEDEGKIANEDQLGLVNNLDSETTLKHDKANGNNENIQLKFLNGKKGADDKLVLSDDLPDTWYTQQMVTTYVDLFVSGENTVLEDTSLVIKLPKTNKINKVEFTDFESSKGQFSEEDSYQLYTYKFKRINGGVHYTTPFTFSFDGHYAKDANDSIAAEVILFANNNKVITQSTKKYAPKTLPLTLDSLPYRLTSQNAHVKHAVTSSENGHLLEADLPADATTNKSYKNYKYNMEFYAMVRPKPVEDIKGAAIGAVYPDELKFTYTFPETVTGLKYNEEKKAYFNGEEIGATYNKVSDRVYEIIVKKPNFAYFNRLVIPVDYPATVSCLHATLEEVDVNKQLEVQIKAEVKLPNSDKWQEVGIRSEKVSIRPIIYSGNGTFDYKKCTTGYNLDEKINYVRKDTYMQLNKQIYKGVHNMLERGGIPVKTELTNKNNGASFAKPYEGGAVTQVKAIYSKLDTAGMYYKSCYLRLYDLETKEPEVKQAEAYKTHYEANKDKTIAAIKENAVLYGIKDDGTEVELANSRGNLYYDPKANEGKPYIINDTAQQYKEIVVKFDKPIILDNACLELQERIWFNDNELASLDKLSDNTHKKYEGTAAVTTIENGNELKGDYKGDNQYKAYFLVEPLHPTVDEHVSQQQNVQYTQDGTFDYLIGPKFSQISDDSNTLGNFTTIKNVRIITLLPAGFAYKSFEKISDKKFTDNIHITWQDFKGEIKVKTVDNFRNTGKTAVIVDYGQVPAPSEKQNINLPISLKLHAENFVTKGAYTFVNYMLYDNNDVIYPIKDNSGNDLYKYQDKIDLDGDNDVNEFFMQKQTVVQFTPGAEVQIINTVKQNIYTNDGKVDEEKGQYGTSTVEDVGSTINLKMHLVNNSYYDVDNLTIIDVLPYKDDQTIAPDSAGKYVKRGSNFNLYLHEAIKLFDANGNDITSNYDIFYLGDAKTGNINILVGSTWINAAQTDFSKQKINAFKAVLKENRKFSKDSAVIANLKCRMDTSNLNLKDTSEWVAINSAAFNTDKSNKYRYNEGNAPKVELVKYQVSGIAFVDINNDGVYDVNADLPAAGIKVDLLKRKSPASALIPTPALFAMARSAASPIPANNAEPNNASELKIPEGWELAKSNIKDVTYSTITAEDGKYSMPVYERVNNSDYMILFTKKDGQTFVGKVSQVKDASDANNKEELKAANNSASTSAITLNPQTRTAIKNVALTQTWTIKLTKLADSEKDAKGANRKLTGAKFKLLKVKAVNKKQAASQATVKTANEANKISSKTEVLKNSNYKKSDLEEAKYKDANGQEQTFKEATTDKNGELKFAKVPYGQYVLEEVEAPKGYKKATNPYYDVPKFKSEPLEISVAVTNKKLASPPELIQPEQAIPYVPSTEVTKPKVGVVTKTGELANSLGSFNIIFVLAYYLSKKPRAY